MSLVSEVAENLSLWSLCKTETQLNRNQFALCHPERRPSDVRSEDGVEGPREFFLYHADLGNSHEIVPDYRFELRKSGRLERPAPKGIPQSGRPRGCEVVPSGVQSVPINQSSTLFSTQLYPTRVALPGADVPSQPG